MSLRTSAIKEVSDTAFWVASYRAIESQRKDALFQDPYADLLVGEYGKSISSAMKRYGKYAYWSVIIRTPIIDDYILKYIQQGYRTVINLGAGLDTRPYRLSLPPGTKWIEVDFPHVVDLKNDKLKDVQPKCELERIGLSLSDVEARQRLFRELNESVGPSIILTEGVVPYLMEEMVSSLAHDIKEQSNFRLWISEYYSPRVYPQYQSPRFKNALSGSPFQFFPSDWFSFFEAYGWTKKEMKYLYDEAVIRKRKFPLPWWVSLLKVFVNEKIITEQIRESSAYIVFEKKT